MFESIELAPADPILGLTEAFQNDERAHKVNLSVGVFKDEHGATPVLKSVKQAEQRLLEEEATKSYVGIAGLATYNQHVRQMMFGENHPILQSNRAVTVQSPGGTGALRIAADFVSRRFPQAKVWCSRPTWANHPSIFKAAGLGVEHYAYLDGQARSLDFDAMLSDLMRLPAGDVVVLHGCCHNPSGVDPTPGQWQQIADCLYQRKLIPLLDFAYQGFGTGLDQDAYGIRTVADRCDELLVCSSFSKNFGLYRERVGALTVVATTATIAEAVLSHLKLCVRTNFSNPPAHGAAIVQSILSDEELRQSWTAELTQMRNRINDMRKLFVETMKQHAPQHDFSFLLEQTGMFSFSGLTGEQVDKLRDEHAIYIVRSGRINVAGITPGNVQKLCRAITAVL